MSEISIKCVRVGMLMTNCYLVYRNDLKEVVIIDPGDNASFLSTCIGNLGLTPAAIFLTHAHLDHIGAVPELKTQFNIPVYVSALDEPMLGDASLNMGSVEIQLDDGDVRLNGGEDLHVGGMDFHVIATPGHTPGGVCFYMETENVLFAGDTMFRFSWGRTDFPGGSERALMASIRDKLLPLPPETIVYPGHEGATRIGDERRIHGYTD